MYALYHAAPDVHVLPANLTPPAWESSPSTPTC
jgi:hypothetical protein